MCILTYMCVYRDLHKKQDESNGLTAIVTSVSFSTMDVSFVPDCVFQMEKVLGATSTARRSRYISCTKQKSATSTDQTD